MGQCGNMCGLTGLLLCLLCQVWRTALAGLLVGVGAAVGECSCLCDILSSVPVCMAVTLLQFSCANLMHRCYHAPARCPSCPVAAIGHVGVSSCDVTCPAIVKCRCLLTPNFPLPTQKCAVTSWPLL